MNLAQKMFTLQQMPSQSRCFSADLPCQCQLQVSSFLFVDMSSVSELPSLLSGFISSPESVMFKDISIVSNDGQIHTASKITLA